jgi:hypothetical protein
MNDFGVIEQNVSDEAIEHAAVQQRRRPPPSHSLSAPASTLVHRADTRSRSVLRLFRTVA